MSGIFIDSAAWISISDDRQRNHNDAVRYYRQVTGEGHQLWTTNHVTSETLTWLRYHSSHGHALAFWGMVAAASHVARLTVEWITSERHEQGWRIFRDYPDQSFSLVDCTSFVVAREIAADAVFTYDSGFQTMGFITEPRAR